MKYFKMYVNSEEALEITKEEARRILDGWWTKDSLQDIFDNDKTFRLYTPCVQVWTNDNGLVPTPGFYGVCE